MKQSFLKRTGMWKRKGPDKGNPQVIQEQAKRTGRRRSYLLAMGSMALAAILILRLYSLQIIQGADYQQRFQSRIRRTVVVRAARGRILDKDGKVLAETVPTYNITMNDLTDDSSSDNNILNSRIRRVIEIVHENKDEMLTDFSIQLVGGSFYFKEMGQTARNRFLADIYGYADPAEMPAQNLQKTAADVVADLADRYGINAGTTDEEDRRTILEMVAARYNLSLNYYQKYIATTLAKDVSDETREAIESEFSSEDDGVQIEEELVRRYHNAQFFSNILGYTGEASTRYCDMT